jgi:hypothetical protein
VVTHPQLKPRVLAGQLHRLDDGRELALPFVYHDPITRKFALVIPPVLAHLEMKEWARLMTEVAEDTGHSVPAYVRDGTTVLGLGALEMFLESGVEPDDAELSVMSEPPATQRHKLRAREQEITEQKRQIAEREREASEQEQSLVRMAAELSTRESSLARREQQIATAHADLDTREQELNERKQRSSVVDPHAANVVPEGEWQEVRSDDAVSIAREPATVVAELSEVSRSIAPYQVDDSEVSDVALPGGARGAPPPLRKRSRHPPPLLAGQSSTSALPQAPSLRHSPPPLRPKPAEALAAIPVALSNPPPLRPPPAELRGAGQVSRSNPPPPLRAQAGEGLAAVPITRSNPPPPLPTTHSAEPPPPLPRSSERPQAVPAQSRPLSNRPPAAANEPSGATRASVPAPAAARASSPPAAAAPARISVAPNSLRPSGLPPAPEPPEGFATLEAPGVMLREDPSELWLFVKLDGGPAQTFAQDPELLVQLGEAGGRPMVVLALAGAASQVVRIVLDGLATSTRALLERLAQNFRVQLALYADGQLEATRVVAAPRESNARAILERLAKPRATPKMGAVKATEQVTRRPPPLRDEQIPFGAARAEPASTASVLDAVRKLEVWSKPEKVDQALLVFSVPKHVIEASSRRALRAAIGFGVALPPVLVARALEHKLADGNAQLVTEQLAAFRHRIERGHNDLDPKATMHNWERLFAQADEVDLAVEAELRTWVERSARESGGPPPDLPLSSAELRRDLGDPGRRLEAIRELCRRAHVSALAPIFGVLDELSPEEVAGAVVALLIFREQAGDGLVAALGSPSQHVRHACALGLGQLKLRRTLPALLKQMEVEPTPSWAEMARALGDFGLPALNNVIRGLKEGERRERFMVGLAHLANHGCAEEVKSLESDPDSTIALAARQALARRSRMEWDDQAVRNQQALRDNSPETRFSQVFYTEAARVTA